MHRDGCAQFPRLRAILDFYAWFAIRFVFSPRLAPCSSCRILDRVSRAGGQARAGDGDLRHGAGARLRCRTIRAGPGRNQRWAPYLVGAALYAAAGLPLFLGRAHLPVWMRHRSQSIGRYMVALPLATACGFAFGRNRDRALQLLPVFGLRQGFAESQAALLVSAMADRQRPVADSSWSPVRQDVTRPADHDPGPGRPAGALLIPVAEAYGFAPLVVLLIVWGGLTGGLYTVGLAFLAARFHGQELAGANAAFVMLYNIGLTVGPPIAGLGMDASPVWGMAIAFAVFFAVILLSGLTRGQRLG